MDASLIQWAARSQTLEHPRSLHPAAAEIVGRKLKVALGIGTSPSVQVCSPSQVAQYDPMKWVVKRCDDKHFVAVQKVPGAISVACLRELYGVTPEPAPWKWERAPFISNFLSPLRFTNFMFPLNADFVADNMRRLIAEGKDGQVPDPREFFADFTPRHGWAAICGAIKWNSPQMLKIHAARLLMGITVCHAGNVLVDPEGRLYSIDHANCLWSDGSDIKLLARHIKRPSQAFDALAEVSRIPERDFRLMFEGLPTTLWPKIGAPLAYFLTRRAKFQEHFGERATHVTAN